MNAPAVDAAGALAGYERLRRCASGERVDEPGLALLMRRGLRAWIEARADAAAKAPTAATASGTDDSPMAGAREELTRLIATMVIGAARTEARS